MNAERKELLDKISEEEYLKEWAILLEKAYKEKNEEEKEALMLFSLGVKSYALPVKALSFVAQEQEVKAIPHHEKNVFLGLANLSGNLILSFSLHALLGESVEEAKKAIFKKRALVMEDGEERYAFTADSVAGAFHIPVSKYQDAGSLAPYVKAVFDWEKEKIYYLDEKAVVAAFKKGIDDAKRE